MEYTRYVKSEIQNEIQIMYNDLGIKKDATKLSLSDCVRVYPKLYQKWHKKMFNIELDIKDCKY